MSGWTAVTLHRAPAWFVYARVSALNASEKEREKERKRERKRERKKENITEPRTDTDTNATCTHTRTHTRRRTDTHARTSLYLHPGRHRRELLHDGRFAFAGDCVWTADRCHKIAHNVVKVRGIPVGCGLGCSAFENPSERGVSSIASRSVA